MLELIQVHGYAGTGLNAVLEHSGAPRGSLYFHFPEGKEQLGERALSLAADHFEALIVGALEGAGPDQGIGEIIEQTLDGLAELLHASDYRIGCPVSVVALEMGSESERLRSVCEQAYESWTAPLQRFLLARGHDEAWARTTASSTISLVEGALIVSRARRDTQPLRDAAHTLRAVLDVAPAPTQARR
ncbi:TetR/AcrR family transcriptional regulator [Nocardioides humilatus]|uniref:TetR/AcrR family transcriptional regulator n=2 Tax=Nocardioides humilatus TaxID=2607660 RepID=A0A5B1L8X5_9ACTN|nr:TetR/AcrR family transcriptional regulator [Nocardioides humilatus]